MQFVVKQPNGCWDWVGCFGKTSPYGVFYLKPKQTTASRAAFLLFKGALSADQQACHTCDRPECVNPEHLFAGTRLDNAADMIAKGRQAKGFSLPHTKLSPQQVEYVRTSDLRVGALAKKLGVSHSRISVIRSETGK
jgi:hypothetical protein